MNMKEVPILSYEKKTVETEDRFLDAKMGKLENEKKCDEAFETRELEVVRWQR